MAKAYADFGYTTAFVSMYPELKGLLDRASAENWDAVRFETELKNEGWYRGRTDSQRAYDTMLALNPAEAARRLEEQRVIAERIVAATGSNIEPGPTGIGWLAQMAVREGWDEKEMTRQVATRFRPTLPTGPTGQTAVNIDSMKERADDYGIAMTDVNLAQWNTNILTGKASIESYESYLQQQAKVQYTSAATFLDQGMTIRQVVDPYLRLAETTLGAPASTFNLMDPKWTAALRAPDDPNRMQTIDEWQRQIRKDARYGYADSTSAKREAAELGGRLDSLMRGST